MRCEACGGNGKIAIIPTKPDGSIDMNAQHPVFVSCPICVGAKYVEDVILKRREPGKTILDSLGLERVVTYRKKR